MAGWTRHSTGGFPGATLPALQPSPISGWEKGTDVFTSGSQEHFTLSNSLTPLDNYGYTQSLASELGKPATDSFPQAHMNLVNQGGYRNWIGQKLIPVSSMDSPFVKTKDGKIQLNECLNVWRKNENPKNLNIILITGKSASSKNNPFSDDEMWFLKQEMICKALKKQYPLIPADQVHMWNDISVKDLTKQLQVVGKKAENNKDAQFLIVYAGHGGAVPARDKPQEGSARGVLGIEPALWEDQLSVLLNDTLPADSKKMVVLDTCKSGAFTAID
jgi:hypothetical protein